MGYDNSIWVFDEQESKLKKINEDGKMILETADLRLVLGEAIAPDAIFDMGGNVYLYDPGKGLFIFDYYGGFSKRIALLGWSTIQPLGKNIIGVKGNKLMIYTPNSIDINEMDLSESIQNMQNLYFTSKGFIALDPAGIQITEWKKE